MNRIRYWLRVAQNVIQTHLVCRVVGHDDSVRYVLPVCPRCGSWLDEGTT